MSNQILKLRRSSVPGKIPTTSSLDFGEIALNTYDGLAFIKKSGSNGEEIVTIGATSGSFTGSLFGTASYSLFAISSSYSTNIGGEPFYIAVFNGTNQLTSSTIYQSASFTSIRNVTTPIDPTNPDVLYVDGTGLPTRNIISAHSDQNQYVQMYIQNFNNSGDASSDIVASADNATESEYYIDMGINSSGYTNTAIVGTQNDAYLYSTGNNLLIGNASTSRKVIIFNGGLDAEANARIYVHEQGTVTVNTNTYNPTNPPSLQVQALNETIFNLISAYGSTDNYLENNIVNANIGTTASADFVAYNDIDPSNQTAGYIDMGINSTNYVPGVDYPGAAGDAYLYTDSHHLILGATSASGDTRVSLFAGGGSEADNSKLILYGHNQHEMTGSLNMSGSLVVTDGITGSLYGTASWAENVLTASYVENALSASYAQTASYVELAQSASYVEQAISASFATTASYVENAQTASYILNAVSAAFATNAATASSADDFIVRGSLTGSDALFTGTITAQRLNVQYITASTEIITGSTKFGTQLTDTHQFTGSVSITGSLTVNGTLNATSSFAQNAVSASFASTASFVQLSQTASYVQQAQSASYILQAVSASFASTASYVQLAQSASYTLNAQSASYVQTAQTASYVQLAQSASYVFQAVSASFAATASFVTLAQTASYVLQAVSASFASTASFVTTAQTASFVTTAQTASFVTTSQTASFVTASNVYGPFGSSSVLSSSYALTASFALNAGGATAITVADEGTSQGTATFLNFTGAGVTATISSNTASINIPGGAGTTFPYTGSAIISGSLQVTGSISSAGGFTGSLLGTASWAQNAITASYVQQAVSSSFATTASYSISSSYAVTASYAMSASQAQTASYALQAVSASYSQTASYGINIVISGSVNNADYIQFNTASSVTDAVGRLYYDSGEGTIKIGMAGGNVVANIGEDLYQYAYNATGAPLTKGQVVYISGSQGNRIAVKLASATAEQGSANTLGLVAESIGTGGEGWIQTEGVMRKLNTTGLVGGQLLYLSSSAGQYTQTKPQAPLHEVRLGYAERIDATVGSIYIKIDNGYEIDELHNVLDTTTTSSYGDLFVKSGSLWVSSKQLTGSYGLTGSFKVTGSLYLSTPTYNTSSVNVLTINTGSNETEYSTITDLTYIKNVVTVGLPGSLNVDFNSIKSAVDSITGATSTNPYAVRVRAGLYNEDPIQMKSFVAVVGDSSETTVVQANDPSQSLFLGADQSLISDMKIQGVTAPSQSAILYYTSQSIASQGIVYVENVRFGANYTHAKMFPVSGGNAAMQLTNIKYGAQPFTLGFYITSDGISTGRMLLRNTTTTAGGIQSTTGLVFAKTDQPNCTLLANLVGLTKVGSGPAQGIGYWVENGGLLRVNTSNLQRFDTGIYVPQVGSAPTIDAVGLNFENCTTDVNIIHTGSIGKVAGTDNFLKTQISYEAPLYEVGQDQRKITVNRKGGDFTSISASVAYITDSSETNRYVIEVGPGEFVEKQIDLRNKPYVSIIGSTIQTTQIRASGSGDFDQILLGPTNEISFLSIYGVNTAGYAAIKVDGTGDNFAQAHKISIYDFDYGVKVFSSLSSSTFYGEYIDINGPFTYGTYVSASNTSASVASMENYYLFPSGGVSTGNYGIGTGAEIDLYTCLFVGDSVAGSTAISLSDGAVSEVAGLDAQDWDYAVRVPNVGAAPTFRMVGAMIHDSITYDFFIEKVGTQGRYQGIADQSKISNVSTDFYWNFLDDTDGENNITRKVSVTFADGTNTDATTLIFKGSPMGVMQGGEISISSGLTVTTAAGFGYLQDTIDTDVYKRIDWNNTNITLAANTNNYLYLNDNAVLSASGIAPDSTTNIILGRVVTNDTGVEFIDQTPYDGEHMSNKISKFNREALGPVFAEGSIVTENVTPFKLDVTQGNYYFSENNFLPAGTSSINLTQYYISASTWARYTSSIVPSKVYASGSQLVPMSASYYTKHTVYLVGQGVDEEYFLVINGNQYATLVEAEGANLPTIPTYFNDGVVSLAAVYVQSGSANVTQIEDIRPVIGFRAAGVNASAVHGNLLGLSADDHTQYLLVDGGRQMSGDLGLGGNDLYNFASVSGSSITASGANITSIIATSIDATAITGSLLGTAATASYVTLAQTASYVQVFPYTGSAIISGSLEVTGSFSTDRDATVNSLTVGKGGGNVASNTAFGIGSLKNNNVGGRNTAIGYLSLYCNINSSHNVAIGQCSLNRNTGGCNVGIGSYALNLNTAGIRNTAVGSFALRANTTGCFNTAVGYYALRCNTIGGAQVAIGYQALRNSNFAATSNSANVAVGYRALCTNNTGANNTAVGTRALQANTSGYRNTSLGSDSLLANTTGRGNVAIGNNSIQTATVGIRNTAIGSFAFRSNDGSTNTALGYSAMLGGNGTTNCTVGIGANALRCVTGGTKNIAIGTAAGYCMTTGNCNVFLGGYTGSVVQATQNNNIFISDGGEGLPSLRLFITGSDGLATFFGTGGVSASAFTGSLLGTASWAQNATTASFITGSNVYGPYGSNSILSASHAVTAAYALNAGAGTSITIADEGTAQGTATFLNFIGDGVTATVSSNTASITIPGGTGATFPYTGSAIISGSLEVTGSFSTDRDATINSVIVGRGAGTPSSASLNLAIGSGSLVSNTTGRRNVAVGNNVLSNNTYGAGNVAIGYKTLQYNTSGFSNTAVGNRALRSNTYGYDNTAIGYSALVSNNTGRCNVAIGNFALFYNNSGDRNIAIGYSALYFNTTGFANVAVGNCSLRYNTCGSGNIAIGYNSLCRNTTGQGNVGVGNCTLRYNTSGIFNTAIGRLSLFCNQIGQSNTAVGFAALRYNISGCNNIAVGYNAGRCIVGSNNVILGSYTGSNNITASSNNIFIADGTGSLRLFITGSNGLATFFGTGGVSASAFTGSLLGTASWAQNAITASYVTGSIFTSTNPVLSASYALSSSFALSASWAPGGNVQVFPYTGSAIISGSLQVTGSFSTDRDATINSVTVGRGSGNIATNTALGSGSLLSNTTGNRSVAVGYAALKSNTVGFYNIAVGHRASFSNVNGRSNVAIGNDALFCNQSGQGNVAIGTRALYCHIINNPSLRPNTAIGYFALYYNTSGTGNTAVGGRSLQANTQGNCNVGIGLKVLESNKTGCYNVAVGSYALSTNISGNSNIAIGYKSGINIKGSNNVVLGGYTGSNDVTASNNNIFISDGAGTLRVFVTGSNGLATFFGTGGVSASAFTGSLLGTASWAQNVVTASYVTGSIFTSTNPALSASYALSSSFALSASWAPGGNVQVFPYTGSAIISGSLELTGSFYTDRDATVNSVTVGRGGGNVASNIALGSRSLLSNTTGVNNVAVGDFSLRSNTSGFNNISVGSCALCSNTVGTGLIAVGHYALCSNITGVTNTAIGNFTLFNNTSGNRNTAIGSYSLRNNTTGAENTAVGFNALRLNTSGQLNVAVGNLALCSNTTGFCNTAVGYNALRFNTIGALNTAISNFALRANTTGDCNTAIGNFALCSNTSGNRNTAIGYRAGCTITTGNNNVFLGGYTGSTAQATENNNIFIADGTGSLRVFITGSDGLATFFGTGGVSASAFTGSLLGTASWAQNAVTASFITLAQSASYVLQAVSASYVTGSIFTSTNNALSASYAITASFALNAGGGGLETKAGSVANTTFAGNPKKATVTFATAFPNTSYAIVVTGEDARSWTIESKVAGSFVINANANTALAGTTYWIATAYGETQ